MYAGLDDPSNLADAPAPKRQKIELAQEGSDEPFVVSKLNSETLKLMQSAVAVVAHLQPGDKIASDRDYKFTYIPSEWKGLGTWYHRAPWKGKGKVLTFRMNRQANVYVTRRPDKKFGKVMREQGFKGTGRYLKGEFGKAIQKLPVVRKLCPAGDVRFEVPSTDVAPTVFVRPVEYNYVEPEPKPPTTTVGALKKLTKHVVDPKKCPKAIALVVKLLQKDQISRSDGWSHTFRFLRIAMREPERAYDSGVRSAYLELIGTVSSKCKELCNPQQAAMVAAWKIWTLTRHDLAADESFEFSRAAKSLQSMIEKLPTYNSQEDESTAGGASDDEDGAGAEEEEDDDDDEDAGDVSDEDGDDVCGSAEPLRCKRAGLFACVQQARANYKFHWAKTTVDMLLKFVTEHKERCFSPQQCEMIQAWNLESLESSRMRKQLRMQGNDADGERAARGSFEVAEKHWEAAQVSGRAAVVGGGRQNQGGQDGKMFGQVGATFVCGW